MRAAGEEAAVTAEGADMTGAVVARWPLEQWAEFCGHRGFALKLTGLLSNASTAPIPVRLRSLSRTHAWLTVAFLPLYQERPPTAPVGGGFTRIPYASLQLGRELGSGAFGRVLLAKLNHADVVVKELFNPSSEVSAPQP